jgi:hypothetical protein
MIHNALDELEQGWLAVCSSCPDLLGLMAKKDHGGDGWIREVVDRCGH